MEAWPIVLATAFGPIAAVVITLWHQGRKQRRDAKMGVFFTLMANRKLQPIQPEWVRALNLIDVIFADAPKVLAAWSSFYDYIHIEPMDTKQFEHRHIELLTAIARDLGFKDLAQVSIDKYYAPRGLGDDMTRQRDIQVELLRVLKGTERLSAVERDGGRD